jgi:hypothetical protein
MDKVAAALLVLMAAGCSDALRDEEPVVSGVEGRTGPVVSDAPGGACELDWRRPIQGSDRYVEIDRDADPPCEVTFREVVRIRGSLSGLAPRLPIAELRDGRLVSATYTEGTLAIWDSDGRLVGSLGLGAGEGPGEFSFPAGLAELSDGSIAVLTGRQFIHVYDVSGDYRTSYSGHRLVGVGHASPVRGELATVRPTGELVRISPEGEQTAIDVMPSTRAMRFVSADGEGLWVADHDGYEVTRVSLDGETGPVIRSSAFGFGAQDPGPNRPNVFGVTVGRNRLIWVQYNTADPDAPRSERPREGLSREEALTVTSQYRDSRLDVVSPDGTLIATRVFDDVSEMPFPISSRRWARLDDDLLQSIIIFEPVLTPR